MPLEHVTEPAHEEDEDQVLPRVLADVATENREDENDGDHQARLDVGELAEPGGRRDQKRHAHHIGDR